jgi:PEGA domain
MFKRLLAATVLLCLSTSAPARADQALDLVRQANAKLKMADFERSMELLRKARSLTHEPKVLGQVYLNLGLNHAVMGDLAKAKSVFRTALTYDPVLVLDPAHIKRSVVKLFHEVQAGLRGELTVRADRPGAKVLVDGKLVGAAPLVEHELPIGAHTVEVRAAGGAQFSERVVIGVNQKSTLRATLRMVKPVGTDGQPQVGGEAGTSGVAPRRGGRRRLWTWVMGGAAVAVLGVGVGLGVAASGDHSDWEQEEIDPARWDELKSSGQTKATAANVMFGVGGALAAGAVVLFFLEGRSPERDASATWVVPLLGRAAGLGLSGSF